MFTKPLAILTLAAMLISGCALIPDRPALVKGSGNVITETRAATGFTSISLEGSADVNVTFGTAESVEITGEDNIIFLIETNVQNHQLVIKTKPLMTYTTSKPVVVKVTAIKLDAVRITGSGNMDVAGINGDAFKVDLTGSGNISLSGTVNTADISLSGSGNIMGSQLKAKSATVALGGSGNIEVYASDSLNATLGGSGDIRYSGNPAKVSKTVTGSGTIHE